MRWWKSGESANRSAIVDFERSPCTGSFGPPQGLGQTYCVVDQGAGHLTGVGQLPKGSFSLSSVSPERPTAPEYLPQKLSSEPNSGTRGLCRKACLERNQSDYIDGLVAASFDAWVDVTGVGCGRAKIGSDRSHRGSLAHQVARVVCWLNAFLVV